MMTRLAYALVIGSLALGAGTAQAALFSLVNGDLESGGLSDGGVIDDSALNQGWYTDGGGTERVVLETDAGNTYLRLGSPASGGFHQAIPTTGVTGQMFLRFDVRYNDEPGDVEGDPMPALRLGMWGETNPWNSLFGGEFPGLNQNKPNPDILPQVDDDLSSVDDSDLPRIEVDLASAPENEWVTFEYIVDMGDGFNHSQGGTPGAEVAYLAFGFSDVYEWNGDSLFVDNVRFEEIPEPTSLALIGLGGLMMLRRRR